MNWKRKTAAFIAAVMVMGTVSVSVTANDNTGLCEHHPEHTADCGYSEGKDGSACEYVCDICEADNKKVSVSEVQDMIKALPDAGDITEATADAVERQLEEIDEKKAELSDEEVDEIDVSLYLAAAAALAALNGQEENEEPMPLADDPECRYSTDGGSNWEEGSLLNDAIWASYTSDVQIKLLKDITLTSDDGYGAILGGENINIVLDGGGHTIKRGEGSTQFYSINSSGATVTLKNITFDGGAEWSGDDPANRTNSGITNTGEIHLLNVANGATLILENGVTLQNNDLSNSYYGAAVTVYNGGKLIMNDGVIIRNNAAKSGGAIAVFGGGEFVMEGGEISGNYAYSGGGAVYTSGTFTMEDGEINGNASGNNGGGVCISNDGVDGAFAMNGGHISENKSVAGGGGVSILSGTFTMKDGSVTENSITGSMGGGVLVHGGSMSVSAAPVVSGNIANDRPNNVYLGQDKIISVSDALTEGADIGVTTAAAPTSSAPLTITDKNAADYGQYFTSDNMHGVTNSGDHAVQFSVQELPVMINGENFTSDNLTINCNGGGTATLDVGTKPYTLTLDNATITSTGSTDGLQTNATDLIIKPVGTNKITATEYGGNAIYAPHSDVTITGEGTLELVSSEGLAIESSILGSGSQAHGGNIVISDAALVKLEGQYKAVGTPGTLTITCSKVEGSTSAEGAYNAVLSAQQGISIDNSEVKVSSEAKDEDGICADFGDIVIENGSEITINTSQHGIYAGGDICVENSKITANVGNGAMVGGKIEINASEIEGISSADNWNAIYSGSSVAITDSAVVVESGYPAIYSNSEMTITGGSVQAKSTENAGIFAYDGAVTIDGAEVLAIGAAFGVGSPYGAEFKNVYVEVSESIDGTEPKEFNEEDDDIYDYKWVKTSVVKQEETPEISIDFENGTLTGFEDGTYSIDGVEVTPKDGSLDVSDYTGKTVSIVKKGSGTTTTDSEEQSLEIPDRPDAPEGVSGGKALIDGVTDEMEYRLEGGDTWTDVTGESVTGLSAGSYEVRYKATKDSFSSEIVTVTVKNADSGSSSSGGGSLSPSYKPNVEETEGGSTTVSTKNPTEGDRVTITPRPDNGYEIDSVTVTDKNGNKIKVTDNGDGTFSFIQPSGKVNVEVTYSEISGNIPDDNRQTEEISNQYFNDVKESDWFSDAAQYVYDKGIMSGTGEGGFSPELNTTRGMIAAILYRMSGEIYPNEETIFTDVPVGAYYNPAVVWGTDNSVISGYNDGLFRPDKYITREELAVLIYNYAIYKDIDVSNIEGMGIREFTDYEDISDWAVTAVRYCVNAGILNGRPDGSFDPRGMATRAEAASVIMRFLEK